MIHPQLFDDVSQIRQTPVCRTQQRGLPTHIGFAAEFVARIGVLLPAIPEHGLPPDVRDHIGDTVRIASDAIRSYITTEARIASGVNSMRIAFASKIEEESIRVAESKGDELMDMEIVYKEQSAVVDAALAASGIVETVPTGSMVNQVFYGDEEERDGDEDEDDIAAYG